MSEINVPMIVSTEISRISEPARYMSWASRARSNSGPVVGRLMTTDTMISPEMTAGRIHPNVEISGLRARRTGYRSRSSSSDIPFARAVVT